MNIDEIREQIDLLDVSLLELINKRAQLARQIGQIKGTTGSVVYQPEREQAVLQHAQARNTGPLSSEAVRRLFTEIMSACRSTERRVSVGYWGPEGSFSHQAAVQRFGHDTDLLALSSITEVFEQVDRKKCDYGVVPVENSIAGVIPETLDRLTSGLSRIVCEIAVPIHHCMASHSPLSDITVVYTGVQPLAQCRGWMRANLPLVKVTEVTTSSRAAEMAADEPSAGAITNTLAASLHDLPVRAEDIEDAVGNVTRFAVIGHQQPIRTGRDKTSITFHVRNRPGALFRALAAFDAYSVNMTMIQSRPVATSPGEYTFHLDLEGHVTDAPLARAIDMLESSGVEIRVLGSYPVFD